MARTPTGGKGSNQYQTRGAPTMVARGTAMDPDSVAVMAAFMPGGAAPWQSWNATPDEIIAWSEAGFTGQETAWWRAHNENTHPTEAAVIVDAYQAKFGVRTPVLWSLWADCAIPPNEWTAWLDTTIVPATLEPWANDPGGFDLNETNRWVNAGFLTPTELRFWQDTVPDDPATAMRAAWSEHRLSTGSGFFAPDTRPWNNPDRTRDRLWRPADYAAWRAAAQKSPTSWYWNDVDENALFSDVTAGHAHEAGFAPTEFVNWVHEIRPQGERPDSDPIEPHPDVIGAEEPYYADAACLWRDMFGDLGTSHERYDRWNDAWKNVRHHCDWIGARVPAPEAAAWSSAMAGASGGDPTGDAATPQWAHNGFSIPDAIRWLPAVVDAAAYLDQPPAEQVTPMAGFLNRRGVTPDPATLVGLYLG